MSPLRTFIFLSIVAASGVAAATPSSSTCTNECTPGAVQCDADGGGVQTCSAQTTSGAAGCTTAAEQVYVVDENNTFSVFNPGPTPSFTDIGTLSCPDLLGTPFSMSVDRSGTAWVLYSDGSIFNVDTTTLACTATAYNGIATGWTNFGMGFTATSSGAATDTLYLANISPLQLGTLDTSTFAVTTVGSLASSPELTGNSLGELWGFFPDATNPRVSELSTTTGAEGTSFPMTMAAGSPMAWAFAFYGGDFYVFLERSSDSSTNVWYVDGTSGAVSEPLTNTGRNIVGAGESTCVPATTCYQWVDTPCGSNMACSNGACSATCAGACTVGATECDSSGQLQQCTINNEIPGLCPVWTPLACTSACKDGICLTACNPDQEFGACGAGQSCVADMGGNYCEDNPATTASAGAASTSAGAGGATTGAAGDTTGGASGNAAANGAGASGAITGAAAGSGNGSGNAAGGNGATNGAAGGNGAGNAGGINGAAAGSTGSGTGESVSTGGCSSTGDSLGALSLLALLDVRRRRRTRLGVR